MINTEKIDEKYVIAVREGKGYISTIRLYLKSSDLRMENDMADPKRVRGYTEALTDNILLMHIISKARRGDLGTTKLAKLVYLIECKLAKDKIKTFNYHFKTFGPFTKEIYEDLEALEENDLIVPETLKLTERGKDILKQCYQLFESDVAPKIDGIIERYDKLSLDEIKKLIYNSKAPLEFGAPKKIKNIPQGTDLKIGISEKDAKAKFMPDRWGETLDIYFDDESCASLNGAMRDARKRRFGHLTGLSRCNPLFYDYNCGSLFEIKR